MPTQFPAAASGLTAIGFVSKHRPKNAFKITLNDDAPIGGATGVQIESLSPGQTRFIDGLTRSFSQAPEGPHDAIVKDVGALSRLRFIRPDSYAVKS